jgi:hypothetical protein
VKAIGQNVEQIAADELRRFEMGDLGLAAVGVVLPAEVDAIVLELEQPWVGDGDAMGVARQVLERLVRSPERGLL